MNLKIFSILLLLCNCHAILGQSYKDLSEELFMKSKFTPDSLELSILDFDSLQWRKSDTIREYKEWLMKNKQPILSESSSLFTVNYFLQLAKAYQVLEINDSAYQNIDSATYYINLLEYPELYKKVLDFGIDIAQSNTDYTTAVRFLQKIIDSKVMEQYPESKGETLLSLAGLLVNTHHYVRANDYSLQAYDIFKESGDEEKLVRVLRLIYEAAHLTSNDNSCMDYLYEAREIAERLGDSLLRSDVYAAFGLANYRNGNHPEAVKYYKMARQLLREKGSYRELWAATYQHLSYTHMDSIEAACNLSKYLLEQCLKNKSPILSNAYRGRAWCFAKNGQNDSAAFYLNMAAKERESGEKADASPGFYYYLYDIANQMKDYKLAVQYLHTSLVQFRKYYRESVAEELSTQRGQFDYDLQKERIKKLDIENKLVKERSKRRQVISILVGILLSVTLIFIILLRNKLRDLDISYKSIVKKNIELDKLNTLLQNGNKKDIFKRKNNTINIKDEEKIYKKVFNLLTKEKIYRQAELTEIKLAEIVQTNTTYLSAIINKKFGMSYKALVNHYRINDARKMLTDEVHSKYSIEGIAIEVGYNSRSAFYSIFKQETGMNPSAYIKAYKKLKNNEQNW